MAHEAIYIRDGWAKCQACGSLFLVDSVQKRTGIDQAKHCPSCGEEVEVWFMSDMPGWESGRYVFEEF